MHGDTARTGRPEHGQGIPGQGHVLGERGVPEMRVEVAGKQRSRRPGVPHRRVRIEEPDARGRAAVRQPAAVQVGEVEHSRIEGAQGWQPRQCPPCSRELVAQEGQVETGVVRDHRQTCEARVQLGNHLSKDRSASDVRLRDPVDAGRPHRALRVEPAHPFVENPSTTVRPKDRQLQDAITLRREPRRLHVDDRETTPGGICASCICAGWLDALPATGCRPATLRDPNRPRSPIESPLRTINRLCLICSAGIKRYQHAPTGGGRIRFFPPLEEPPVPAARRRWSWSPSSR
jgi:hypothetical protein